MFSEYGLMKARVKVELNWLKALAAEAKIAEVPAFSAATLAEIDGVIAGFSLEDAAASKPSKPPPTTMSKPSNTGSKTVSKTTPKWPP